MADHPSINVALYAQTDVGMVRSGNEDNFLILDLSTGTSWSAGDEAEPHELLTFQQGYYGTLLAVSDGMGGALAGEVASRLAVETVRDRMLQLQAHGHYGKLPFQERLRLAIEEANLLIHADGLGNPAHKGLGATFTGVATNGDQAYFAQVGDSRAYLIRQGKIARITKDQSLVQQLIDAGQITEEEAETHSYRNVILQALGAHINVNVEVNTLSVCHLDTLVLCSDGLSGKLHAEEILAIVSEASDFKSACQKLINLANQRGGEDNITVVIAQFSGNGLTKPDNETIEPQGIARSPDTPTELNWSWGATTDQLTDPLGPPDDGPSTATGQAAPISTEPLTATAPVPPPPITAPLPSRTASLNRAAEPTGSRGPITAVFELGDFEEELAASRSAKAAAAAAQPSAPEMPQAPEKPAAMGVAASATTTSRSFSVLPVLLTILALAGIIGFGFWSYNQQKQQKKDAQAAQQQQQDAAQTRRQEQLTQLSNQLTELGKKLAAAAKLEADKRSKLEQKLVEARQDLEAVEQLPAVPFDEIEKRCSDIAKKLKKIEEDLDSSLQGWLPNSHFQRSNLQL